MPKSDPIADRIEQLQDQWLAFANQPHARLLIWRAAAGEAAVVDAFITRERDSEIAETPDLFLELSAGFSDEVTHCDALVRELTEAYDAVAPQVETADDARWQAPRRNAREEELSFLVRVLASFRSFHAGQSEARLAVQLEPANVASLENYLRWLQRLVHESPSELRFFTVVDATDTAYAPLAKAEPVHVVMRECRLEMGQAMRVLADRAGARTPGDVFRQLQLELAEKLGRGDLSTALPLAAAAEKLASEQAWPELGVVICMMLGGGYASRAEQRAALDAYVAAERHASARETQEAARTSAGDPPAIGRKLRLQARLAQGATLFAMHAYKQAATLYQETIALAHELADARAELDCHRLASLCYAQDGQTHAAWQLGLHGLRVGLAMDEETRRTSTLPYLADQLLRLCAERADLSAHRRPLEEQLAQALGARWRAALSLEKVA